MCDHVCPHLASLPASINFMIHHQHKVSCQMKCATKCPTSHIWTSLPKSINLCADIFRCLGNRLAIVFAHSLILILQKNFFFRVSIQTVVFPLKVVFCFDCSNICLKNAGLARQVGKRVGVIVVSLAGRWPCHRLLRYFVEIAATLTSVQ